MLIFGLLGWPLAFNLLRHLPDRGFAFARPIGLLFTGYILWLGGSFHLLQNNLSGIFMAMAAVLGLGIFWQRRRPAMFTWAKREWRYMLAIELLFHVAFLGWVAFKSYNPNIETSGGEKWMEITFINGVLRSTNFPPQDPWLSGFGISYYYFGYVLMAMVTQLTGIVSTTAFNLYIPTLFALTLTAACGVVANLVGLHQRQFDPKTPLTYAKLTTTMITTGLVAALFVGCMGNLVGVFEVVHKRGLIMSPEFWSWLDIRDLKIAPTSPSDNWIPDRFMWWWRGSRVLTDYNLAGQEQEVIDEFPMFSFLLGDVHPHVLALPFVLLVTTLALNLLANPIPLSPAPPAEEQSTIDKISHFLQNSWLELRHAVGGRLALLLYAIAIGSLGFLNTWDLPIYLGIISLSFMVWLTHYYDTWEEAIWRGFIGTLMLTVISIALYLPFYATFQSQAGGILPNLWNPTRLPHFFTFFGVFLTAIIGLLTALSAQNSGWAKPLRWTLPFTLLGPIALLVAVVGMVMLSERGSQYIQGILNDPQVQQLIGGANFNALVTTAFWRRVTTPWTFLLLGGMLGWVMALLIGLATSSPSNIDGTKKSLAEKFVLILLIMGLALPLSVEFIFLRDNFGYRMNTIFKFYFQAWVLMALSSAFAIYYLAHYRRNIFVTMWQLTMAVLVAGALIYPTLAVADKANYFQNTPTLDGMNWIAQQNPNDYTAIQWLRDHAPANAVVLEAPGAGYVSYQYVGRVSALTGIPTLLGWGGHQNQWRGNYDEPARREPEIERLFSTTDPQQALALLDKYRVSYVYVGGLEHERYKPAGLDKFQYIMDIAFQEGNVTIYQRR